MEEKFTFADSTTGLEHALLTTLSLRRFGFSVRLATHTQTVGKETYVLHTVHATPPARPNRAERGAIVEAPYKAQAREIADTYNRLADAERRPDLEC